MTVLILGYWVLGADRFNCTWYLHSTGETTIVIVSPLSVPGTKTDPHPCDRDNLFLPKPFNMKASAGFTTKKDPKFITTEGTPVSLLNAKEGGKLPPPKPAVPSRKVAKGSTKKLESLHVAPADRGTYNVEEGSFDRKDGSLGRLAPDPEALPPPPKPPVPSRLVEKGTGKKLKELHVDEDEKQLRERELSKTVALRTSLLLDHGKLHTLF